MHCNDIFDLRNIFGSSDIWSDMILCQKVHIQEKYTAAYINLRLLLEISDEPKLRQRYEKFNDGEEYKRTDVGTTYES